MRLGVVSRLWRYPVKSMLGEACEQLDLDARGVAGDRRFAIRDPAGKLGSGKTTRRFRQIDGLFEFRAADRGEVPEIVFPDGRRMLGNDPDIHAALSAALGQPVTLARETDVSHLDVGAVHLLTTASLAWLGRALPDAAVDERRFRPNVVLDVAGDGPVERDWLGRSLRIGPDAVLRISKPTARCRMVTLAQSELPDDARILREIARDLDVGFGVYADVVVAGRIRLGDSVTVSSSGGS